ncbi:MAG: hypothetical protein Q7U91_17315 [Sideroxyarcus sp.]|nr:hypothetical protein [Sideroxyarcus sp.]
MPLRFVFRTSIFLLSLLLPGCVAPSQPAGGAAARELLTPWSMVTGGPLLQTSATGGLQQGMAGFVQLRHPTAVSVLNNDVYLADASLRRIYRYSRTRQTFEPFTDLVADAAMRIYASPDLTVYVTDAARSRVLQYSRDGQLLRTYSSEMNLGRPVAVTQDASGGLLVADGLYGQVVSFNRLGLPLFVADRRGIEDRVQGISDMARGPEGLYLLDRLGAQVVLLGLNGEYRMSFGKGELSQPGAIAADRSGRVYVSDNFDNSISIYSRGKRLAKYGSSGSMPGAFNQITALWADEGKLYVADSLNARIQILLVSPASAGGKDGRHE